jgi:hypothetical protein
MPQVEPNHHDRGQRESKRTAQRQRPALASVMRMNQGSLATDRSTNMRQIWSKVSRPKTALVVMT